MTSSDRAHKSLQDLRDVMASLRDPDGGCPWDQTQTFATIAPYTIEEAYEVADAIARQDLVDLRDELGDLLLQVVYHAQMAAEQRAFDLDDVITGITEKMIRRHPHVFGDAETRAKGAAPGFWERIKDEERRAKREARQASGQPDEATPSSVLDDVPPALPALTRAIKLQNKAARVGFDWPSLAPVLEKMREELAELDEAIADKTPADQHEEFGDLMFVMANVARHLKIDPEAALSAANAKFTRRFQAVERSLAHEGRAPGEATLEEMDGHWDAAKRAERGEKP
ncbi:MAG: nucleoside triphosphate pyrophosphohydrolase [Pseudomonadota bacterium]